MENTMEKYDAEAISLATIVRFSAMIPSLIIALVTTRGRAYKWVMGLGLQLVLLGIRGHFYWSSAVFGDQFDKEDICYICVLICPDSHDFSYRAVSYDLP